VAQNPRWGRTYESFGATPDLAELLGAAEIRGFQGPVLGTEGEGVADVLFGDFPTRGKLPCDWPQTMA
jgi:beta-glucosidase